GADARDPVRREARDVLVADEHAAGRRPVDAGAAVDHARLAGAVRADERAERSRRDRERDVVERADAAELERHALDREAEARAGVRLLGYESHRDLRRYRFVLA